jgi:arsenic resistance protein ArsH
VTIPTSLLWREGLGEFGKAGRMRPSPFCKRIFDMMEEFVKFLHPTRGHPTRGHPTRGHPTRGHPTRGHSTRGHPAWLSNRYSERVESAEQVSQRVNQRPVLSQVAPDRSGATLSSRQFALL